MKIVLVLSGLTAGGTERVAVRLAGWLHAAGHDVALVTLSATSTDFYAMPAGVKRVALDVQTPSSGIVSALRNNWRRLRRIRSSFSSESPDVLIALGHQMNVIMLLASLGIGCPKVISERGDPARDHLSYVWRLLRRLTYPMATLHVAQSRYASHWINRRFPKLRCVVIGNTAGNLSPPPDPGLSISAGGGAVQLIAVSRMSPEKGLDLLLAAFATARAAGARIALSLVGEGPKRAALERQAAALDIASSVTFVGTIDDVPRLMRTFDIFVLPSRVEGFPNAMVEAMSVGLPVIAAACPGGAADILGDVDDRYGLSIVPGDVAGLSAAIVRLAGSEELRRELSAAGLERAAEYRPERIAAEWVKAIAALKGDVG